MEKNFQSCVHIPKHISHVCCAVDCDDKFLCKQCRTNHNIFHSDFIKPYEVFMKSDPKLQIDHAINKLKDLTVHNERIISLYNDVFDKITKEMINFVQGRKLELKNKYLPDFGKELQGPHTLALDLKRIKDLYSNSNEPSDAMKTLLEYREKYIEFEQSLNTQAEDLQARLIKSISYKELDNQVDSLLNIIREGFYNFENICLKGKNQDKSQVEHQGIVNKQHISHLDEFNIDNINHDINLKLTASPGWSSIEYINDHNLIVIGDDIGSIQVWNAKTFECLSIERHHSLKINSLKFSLKHKILLTASNDSTIKAFAIETPPFLKTVRALEEHVDKVWSLLLLDDRDMFYSSGKEPCIIGWDLNTLMPSQKLLTRGRDTTGTEMTFIHRLNALVVSFKSGTLSLYDIQKGTEIMCLNVNQQWIHALTYIESTNQLLIGTCSGLIEAWSVEEDLKYIGKYEIPGAIPTSMIAVNKGKELLLTSRHHQLIALDLTTKKHRTSPKFNFDEAVNFKILGQINRIMVVSNEIDIAVMKF